MKRIAVTGTTGFAGKRLMEYNREKYQPVSVLLREKKPAELDLQGIDVVIHLAGKAHDMSRAEDSIYFSINYGLTKELADRAKQQGVQQFIYISSTKVYGDLVQGVLNEKSPCNPTDAYGASKLKAEQYLQSIETASFKVAIVRPPLVYGPDVKGNMIRLLQLAAKNIPLPFGDTRNLRSMVFIDNLIELINIIIERKAGGVFVAGDSKPVATDELIRYMRKGLGNSHRLFSIPVFIRNAVKKIKPSLYARLFGSFVVDNSITNAALDFTPPYTTGEGVIKMTSWFKNKPSK